MARNPHARGVVRHSSISVNSAFSEGSSSRTIREREMREMQAAVQRDRAELERSMDSLARQRIVEATQEAGMRLGVEDDMWMPESFDAEMEPDREGGDELREEGDGDGSSDSSEEEKEVEDDAGLYSRNRRHKKRSRADNNASLHKEWARLAPELMVAYLDYLDDAEPSSADAVDDQLHHFTILVIGQDTARVLLVPQRVEDSAAVALARVGCLPGHPTKPRVAFEIRGLEHHRQLRMALPSCNAMPWMKAVCQLAKLKYRESLREAFSLALDAYLAILRDVQVLVDKELHRDGKDWYAKYSCPPCGHRLKGEKPLVPDRMHASDGNESQKRVLNCGPTDHRVFKNGVWVLPDEVDVFKDDVRRDKEKGKAKAKGKAKGKGKEKEKEKADGEDEDEEDEEGVCPAVETWKAERAQTEKVSYTEIFKQTGVYLCSCRHGIVEFIEQMVQTGEQAKYCLAITNRILEIFGEDQLLATDIGCSMKETIKKSSLGDRAASLRLLVIVNAFHGWAHKRECQIYNHPLFRKGLGIEDLEVCERIFSSLNGVAAGVRHASDFHYLQFITLHLEGLRRDKYGALTKFMRNNHKQSVTIIADNNSLLSKRAHTSEDYEAWLQDERAYFKSLRNESAADKLKTKYQAVRIDLEMQRAVHARLTDTPAVQLIGHILGEGTPLNMLEAYKARECASAYRKLVGIEKRATTLERELGIARWATDSPEFLKAQTYAVQRKLVLALRKLERLLVARLQELSRAHLRRISYKERKKVAKAITARGSAIRTAVNSVNRLRAIHQPGAPKLAYKEVVEMGYTAELDFLRASEQGVLEKPWMDRKNREAQTAYFKRMRAKEELERLNHEIPRMQDWIEVENAEYADAIKRLREASPGEPLAYSPRGLAVHLEREAASRLIQNDEHQRVLDEIYRDKAYTGPRPSLRRTYRPDVSLPNDIPSRSSRPNDARPPSSTTPAQSGSLDLMDVDGEEGRLERLGEELLDDDDDDAGKDDGDDIEGLAGAFGDLITSY